MDNASKKHRCGRFFLSLEGFSAEAAEDWFALKKIKRYARPNDLGVSHKTILSLLPFDAQVDRSLLPSGVKTHQLFSDRLSTRYALSRCGELLPETYFALLTRDGERFIQSFGAGESYECSENGIVKLLRDKKSIVIRPSENRPDTRETAVSFDGADYHIGDMSIDDGELMRMLGDLPDDHLICENVPAAADFTLRIATVNNGTPEVLFSVLTRAEGEEHCFYTDNRVFAEVDENGAYDGGKIEGFGGIAQKLLTIAADFSDLEFMCFSLRLTADGFRILSVDTGRDLCLLEHFNEKTAAFLRRKLERKRRLVTAKQLLILIYRSLWQLRAEKHGFVDFMYRNWRRALREDRRDKYTTRAEKRWAHKRGFLSFRIKQYGLTEENYKNCLSDRDYKWLRPINNRYFKWIWDKVSLRYILDDYSEYLPEYYFNFVKRDGKTVLLPMRDMPGGYTASFPELLRLLREKGVLALKQTEGSHGAGFYKLAYTDGAYLVNGREKSESEMLAFLGSLKRYYNVSEYVVMHPELRRIYDGAACTVRVMVINRTGLDPVIENAYFRIGTKSTGFTDNIGSGGIFAYADEKTGRFGRAEVIRKHIITPCPTHPDTGADIDGVFPHWEEVCRVIRDISLHLKPIEYMGFDVVLTEKGFKILEINTHQDLHRYPTYNENVHKWFMHKLEMKKSGKRLA